MHNFLTEDIPGLKINPSLKDALENFEVLFSQLWDISVDGMRLTDENGLILTVNDSFCEIVEMEKENLIGKVFSIVYDFPEREKALKTYLNDLRNNELKTHFERETKLWNGKKIWFDFSNSILSLDDNRKITLSIIKDITDRKDAEFEIRQSEMKFRMLFNNANDAVFVTQLSEGKSYGDFIEVNEIACRRLGYTKDEFLKLSPSAIISPKSINDFNKYSDKLLREGHVIYDIEHKAKDRKIVPVEINSHLFLFGNRLTVLSIARDITERKQSEERLKISSKRLRDLAAHLQSIREEERSTIAREIHDELGQVLTVLKIQISLLANKIKNDKVIKEKIEELAGVIDSSIESVQRITAKLRPTILDELGLPEAIEWQAQEFEKRTGIRCSLVLPGELTIDSERATAVFRIFQEALTNVARHSKAGKVSISLLSDGTDLHLEIKDNGRGITTEEIKDFNSLGILGIKERALIFGGEVYIDGLMNKGTTVKLKISLKDQDE